MLHLTSFDKILNFSLRTVKSFAIMLVEKEFFMIGTAN